MIALILAGIVCGSAFGQAQVRRLTLNEAVHLALSQNRALKIARLKVVEIYYKKAGERASYFPRLTNQSTALHVTDLQNLAIAAGSLGSVGGQLVPARNEFIPQGDNKLLSSGTQLSQPLTQLIRIHQANKIAASDVAISRDDVRKAENQIVLQVHNRRRIIRP